MLFKMCVGGSGCSFDNRTVKAFILFCILDERCRIYISSDETVEAISDYV